MSERICSIQDCGRIVMCHGWCNTHYQRFRNRGTVDAHIPVRPLGSGRSKHTEGYTLIYKPGHPLADHNGYVSEHRLVMWEAGRLSDRRLIVHHINGVKTDNRIENLEVVSAADHNRRHAGVRRPLLADPALCVECGAEFRATRSDAKWCSGACGNRNFRRRHR